MIDKYLLRWQIDRYLLRWKLRDIRRSAKLFFGWILLLLFFTSITIWLLDDLISNFPSE
jgi:hypothetical protein